MTPAPIIDINQIANHDPDRRGIFIHAAQLAGGPFKPGDRFSLRKGKHQLFSITIVRDEQGDIFFDQHGLFIPRTRKVDMLLGGIFDQFVFYLEPEIPNTIKLRPLEIVQNPQPPWD